MTTRGGCHDADLRQVEWTVDQCTRLSWLVPVLGAVGLAGLDTVRATALTVLGLAMLVGIAYAVAGLGALAALMAPVLLGPSPSERIAVLEGRPAASPSVAGSPGRCTIRSGTR